jgi:two-component system response regulator NreC
MSAHLHLAPAPTDTDVEPSDGRYIRIVLADDHASMRRSLRLLLENEEGVEVIAEAGDLSSVVRHVHGHQPHVLVLDLGMSNGSSIETIGRLRERVRDTQIVVHTMDEDPVLAQRALSAGAVGFVLKDRADTELPEAVRAAARSEEYISSRIATRLRALQRSLTEDKLSTREIEVLRLIALGHTSAEITHKLHFSPRTVETHRGSIHQKLGLSRTEAMSVCPRPMPPS